MQNNNSNKVHARFVATVVLSLAVTFALIGCDEPNVRVSLNNDAGPGFAFSGSGYLDFFAVLEIAPDNESTSGQPKKNRVLWQIWPKSSAEGRLPLSPITYGMVPPGFVQKIPENGAPPKLEEGKIYQAGGPPIVVPRGFVRFVIRNGKATVLP